MNKTVRVVVVLAFSTLLPALVVGQTPVVTNFTGGSEFGIFYGLSTGDVVGFRFTADSNLQLTHLGVYDDNRNTLNPGLDAAHEVGLWDTPGGNLLCQATVDNTGLHVGQFYYAPATCPQLVAGNQYTLGALYTADDNDSYISTPASVSLDMISGTNGVFPTAGDLGFVYPASNSTNLARFGPNALYVPEPTSLISMLVGCGLLLLRRR